MNLVKPRRRRDFKYSLKHNRIYAPFDEDIYLLNPHVVLDGQILWDAIEICPKEGWVIVLEHTDGDNFNRDSAPIQPPKLKTLHGKVEIVEPIIDPTRSYKSPEVS